MNTKTKIIIASGLLLATAAPFVACARRAPAAKPIPTTNAAIIDVKPTEETTTETETETTYETTAADPVGAPVEKLVTEQETEQTTAATVAKKTTKKTAKKTKKKSKKSSKKSGKKSASSKFTYGKSVYTAKGFKIYVNINKDNTANISIVHDRSTKDTECDNHFSLTGKINPKTGFMTYNNCSKLYHVKTSHVNQTRADYLHGYGNMTFNGNSLTWFDGVEGYANSVTFHKQ